MKLRYFISSVEHFTTIGYKGGNKAGMSNSYSLIFTLENENHIKGQTFFVYGFYSIEKVKYLSVYYCLSHVVFSLTVLVDKNIGKSGNNVQKKQQKCKRNSIKNVVKSD